MANKAPLNPVDLTPKPFHYERMSVTVFQDEKSRDSGITLLDVDVVNEESLNAVLSSEVLESLKNFLEPEELELLKSYTEQSLETNRLSKGLSAFEQMSLAQNDLVNHIANEIHKLKGRNADETIRDHLHFNLRLNNGSWAHVYAISSKPYDDVVN
jgi:hypothetical protein